MAKAWRLTPAQWRAQSVDDRALMMAFEMFEGVVESYKDEWREEQREKKDSRKKSGGDDYARLKAMQRQMNR